MFFFNPGKLESKLTKLRLSRGKSSLRIRSKAQFKLSGKSRKGKLDSYDETKPIATKSVPLFPLKEYISLMKEWRNAILSAEESEVVSTSPAFSRGPEFLPIFPGEGTPAVFPAGGDPASVRAPVSPLMRNKFSFREFKTERITDRVLSSEGAPGFPADASKFFIKTRSAPAFSTEGSNFFSETGSASVFHK